MVEDGLTAYDAIYDFVRTVPQGTVVTYGQVADCARGMSFTARQVGTAMRYAPSDVPWHRVVGAGGHLAIGRLSTEAKLRQQRLLVEEGIRFHDRDCDRVDLPRSQWHAPNPAAESGDMLAE